MKILQTIALSGLLWMTPAAFLSLTAPSVEAQTGEIRIQTRLAGGSLNGVTPSGSSRFRARRADSNFSVEVEDVNLADGTVLQVTVGGQAAGSITLRLRGGEIDVNTKDGDIVPQAKAGDLVVVSGPNGAILSGVLR